MRNVEITPEEIAAIRSFDDFDMKMFVSEVSEHGWTVARALIPLIVAAAVQQ